MIPADPRALVIHTDGSAITRNPGSIVGHAIYVSYPEQCARSEETISVSYNEGTSVQMELAGVTAAFKWISEHESQLRSCDITAAIIYCDNQHVVDGVNNYIYSWMQNRWKTRDNITIKNKELWQELSRARRSCKFNVVVRWKKGKSDNDSRIVDKAAKLAAKTMTQRMNPSSTIRHVGRSLSGAKFSKVVFPMTQTRALIYVVSHSQRGKSRNAEIEIVFEHIIDNKVAGKYIAYSTRAIDSELDRGNFFEVEFEARGDIPFIVKVLIQLSEQQRTALIKEVLRSLDDNK